MKLSHLFESHELLLEVKARIEHPEDLIWDSGAKGAQQALKILELSAQQPEHVTIKFDGSPALVAGWRGGEFMLTDKAGFSAKGYDGLTTNAQDLERMILNRKIKLDTPEAKAARQSYASKIAQLYPLLKQVIPHSLTGFVQGDLLWTHTPPEQHDAYVFQPNKIKYQVPVSSDLGKQIGMSQVGIVFHSMYNSPQDAEPQALRDPGELGIKSTTQVVVVPHEMQFAQPFELDAGLKKKVQQLIQSKGAQVNEFLNPVRLSDRQIKGLPMVMKSFLAHKAGEGETDFSHASEQFLQYLVSKKAKVTQKARENMLTWIEQNVVAYNTVWQMVQLLVDIKLDLKQQMDATVGDKVKADLHDVPGHEGFVSVTPEGIIKLVNRAQFMKKDAPLTEQTADSAESHSPHRVVFAFGRMNPPTRGHKKLMDKVAAQAGNDDYWIFLSHKQEPVENPLDWHTKMKFIKSIIPAYASHLASGAQFESIKTPLLAMDWLYNQGYRDITMVAGEPDVPLFTKMLTSWNSEAIRTKYKREPVTWKMVSAGKRDPNAKGVQGISGTLVRKLATQGDFSKFKTAVGLSDELAQDLYTQVRKGMMLNPMQESTRNDLGTIVMLHMNQTHAHKLAAWCAQHGIPCINPEHMHLTLISTLRPEPYLLNLNNTETHVITKPVSWEVLGNSSLVLKLDSPQCMSMHAHLIKSGMRHKFANYIPHVSVSYKWHAGLVLPAKVPDFELVFDWVEADRVDPNFAAKTS
jgi:hypothetical protein